MHRVLDEGKTALWAYSKGIVGVLEVSRLAFYRLVQRSWARNAVKIYKRINGFRYCLGHGSSDSLPIAGLARSRNLCCCFFLCTSFHILHGF